MMGGFHMGGGWFWLTFIVVMLLLIGYFALQTSSNKTHNEPTATAYQKPKGQRKTAREIADERYANGEISREEYNTIIEDLERDHAAS